MPCVGTAQGEFLYSDTLSEIDALISSHPSCSCLIGGDFNVELDCNNNISMLVSNFNCNNKLLRCDVVFPVADRLTYYNESLQCGSATDYFLTSNLKDTIAFNILDLDINCLTIVRLWQFVFTVTIHVSLYPSKAAAAIHAPRT